MEKIKNFIINYKLIVIVFLVGIGLLITELIIVNNKVNPKDTKKNDESNISSNLTEKEKHVLGLSSNSNSNQSKEKLNEAIEKIQEKKEEDKKSEKYKEYEKLTEEEKKKIDAIPSEKDTNKDVIEDLKKDEDYNNTDEIPSKFNLSDVIKLNFKNQGTYGLCWDFASMKSIETYLQLHNLGEYNFSEIAVDYIMSENLYGERQLHSGGRFEVAVSSTAINNGLIETKNMPNSEYYYDYTEEEYNKFTDINKQPIVVTEIVSFPTVYKMDGKYYDSSLQYEFSDLEMEELRSLMKKHIMANGSIYMPHNGEAIEHGGDSFYVEDEKGFINHAVSIVGWDDNYPKEKIVRVEYKCLNEEDYTNCYYAPTDQHPSKDGAFILANSWDTEEYYAYVSYEDAFLYKELRGVKSTTFENSLNLDNIQNEKLKEYLSNKFSAYIVEYENKKYIPRTITSNESWLKLNNLNLTNEDLEVLKYFDSLYILELNDNNITSIEILKDLKELSILSIENNNVTDVSPLKDLKEISILKADNNDIRDISVLKDTKIEVYSLDNNKNISGYTRLFEGLKNVDVVDIQLHLKNCNITNFDNSDVEYTTLDLSENPELNIFGKINTKYLYLDNNKLEDLTILNNVNTDKLYSISLVNNNIKDVEPLTQFTNLDIIDLSSNKNIENLEKLKVIYNNDTYNLRNPNEGNYGVYNSIKKIFDEEESEIEEENIPYMFVNTALSLYLNDCNISDFSKINELYIGGTLSLKDNNIKSIKDLKVDNLYTIDLSNNSFEDDSYAKLFEHDITYIYLSNCNISDLSALNNISSDKYVGLLDLSNNNIKDSTPLSNINISTLSLSDNKGISGKLPKEVFAINISNCDINNDSFDISELRKLTLLNITNNSNFTNYTELMTNSNIYDLYINGSMFDVETLENIESFFTIHGDINTKYNKVNNTINVLDNKFIYKDLIKNIFKIRTNYTMENCTIDKYLNTITLNNDIDKCIIRVDTYEGDTTNYIFNTD